MSISFKSTAVKKLGQLVRKHLLCDVPSALKRCFLEQNFLEKGMYKSPEKIKLSLLKKKINEREIRQMIHRSV